MLRTLHKFSQKSTELKILISLNKYLYTEILKHDISKIRYRMKDETVNGNATSRIVNQCPSPITLQF